MATATAKKVTAKKVTAKKTGSKPVAKKVAAKKVTPKKVNGSKVDPAVAATKKAATEAAKVAREKEKDSQITEVMRLRSEGQKWPEVAAATGLSLGKAQLLFQIGEGRKAGVRKPTPALVRHDRDVEKMGWGEIMARYGLSKGGAQNLYREAGGDPHKSYVGKGGRYFSHEADIAPLREANKAAKTTKRTTDVKPKTKTAGSKPVFAEDADAEAIKTKLEGKTITSVATIKGTESSKEFKVKPGSVKVGTSKDKKNRIIQFTNSETGGTHTLHLSSITKVAR